MRKLLLPLMLLWLAGCSVAPPLPQPDDPHSAWLTRKVELQHIDNWQLGGRLLIVTGHETWNTSINWRQQGEAYRIMLIAPLGQGSMKLEGDQYVVTLQPHDGEAVQHTDPEALLAQQLGWKVPVPSLRYWVLGLPAPGPHSIEVNGHGLLNTLQQGGWAIEFRDYHERHGLLLPGRIFANNHQAKVRLVIGNWQRLDE